MYSKMLRQFSKGSLISISSESSKVHLLIKVLYTLSGLTFADDIPCPTLSMSPCAISCSATLCLSTQVFRHEIFQLCQCQYTCVRDHLHIKSSHSLHENDAKFQTHPPSTLRVKMPDLPKIDVYNVRCKISVGILMKFFFLSHKCINK